MHGGHGVSNDPGPAETGVCRGRGQTARTKGVGEGSGGTRESVSQKKGNRYAAAADPLSTRALIPDFYVKYALLF